MPEYVTAAELTALLGPSAAAARVALATDAANLLVPAWCEQAPPEPAPVARGGSWARWDPRVPRRAVRVAEDLAPDAPVTPITRQAALELAHELYRAHAAVGGVFSIDDLLARLPADRVRPIRDLLDAEAHAWGIG